MRTAVTVAALAFAACASAAPADDLAWLKGAWTQQKDGAVVQETWRAAPTGGLEGVTVTTRPGKPAFTERASISVEGAGLTYTARVPNQPPTPFVLVRRGKDEAVFENKVHDFPQRIIYRRCGADLCAAIEGVMDGKPAREEWRYRRVAPPTPLQ
jgi:hypothetical protein